MNVLDALLGEHAAVKGLLSHIEKDPSNDSLLQLAKDLLESHAKIEEELLYRGGAKPELAPDEISEMLRDHKKITETLGKALETNTKILRSPRVQEFIATVREHLHDEESRIFPKLAGTVSDDMLNSLEKRWAEFRKVGENGGSSPKT